MSDINNSCEWLRNQCIQAMLEEKHRDSMITTLHENLDGLVKSIKDKPYKEQVRILETVRQALLTIKEAAK